MQKAFSRSLWLATFLALPLLTGAATPIDPLLQLVIKGRSISPAQAATLESNLANYSKDAQSRAQLLGYYFHAVQTQQAATPREIRQARGRLISWLVTNDPRSALLGYSDAFAMSGYLFDPQNLHDISALWLQQIDLYPDDTAVLLNAIMVFQQSDRALALKLAQHCYELTKGQDRRVAVTYGTQLTMNIVATQPDLRQNARNQLAALTDPVVLGIAASMYARDNLDDKQSPADPDTARFMRSLLQRALANSPAASFTETWQHSLQTLDSWLSAQ